MTGVFISYRRSDSEGFAGRIYDNLITKLRPDSVFLDVDKIAVGADFVAAVTSNIDRANVVLVVIGPTWASTSRSGGQVRLHDPEDPVATEVRLALAARKSIIPVLCGGASMPSESELPEDLRAFCKLNAVRLTSERFRRDLLELEAAIDACLAVGAQHENASVAAVAGQINRAKHIKTGNAPFKTGLGGRTASASFGGYTYEEVAQYEGLFQLVRRDFLVRDQLHAYAMRIEWDVHARLLIVQHRGVEGSQYRQFGAIAFAKNAHYLSIESGDQGWRQLAILERMDFQRTMYGALFALGNVSRRTFLPVITPIVLIGYSGPEKDTRHVYPVDSDYEELYEHLRRSRQDCLDVIDGPNRS